MRQTKVYITSLLLFFLLSTTIVTSQTSRVQKLYSRSLMNGKEVVQFKKVTLNILGKNHQPLTNAYVQVTGMELEFETDNNGQAIIELPKNWKNDQLELEIRNRRHFTKTIHVSLEGVNESSRTVQLKYNRKSKCYRVTICPNF